MTSEQRLHKLHWLMNFTTQMWVALLIGWGKFLSRHNQSDALPSMECHVSNLLRRHFAVSDRLLSQFQRLMLLSIIRSPKDVTQKPEKKIPNNINKYKQHYQLQNAKGNPKFTVFAAREIPVFLFRTPNNPGCRSLFIMRLQRSLKCVCLSNKGVLF